MYRFLFLWLFSVAPFSLSAADDCWRITIRDTTNYTPATMANGEIGLVVGRMPFQIESIILGSAHQRGDKNSVSCILESINPLGVIMYADNHRISSIDMREWEQQIDLARAVHTTRFSTEAITVNYKIRALRNMPYALMIEVEIEALRDTEIQIFNHHEIPVNFADTLRENSTVWCEDGGRKVQCSVGSYNGGQNHAVASSTFLCRQGNFNLESDKLSIRLRKADTASFALVGAVCTSDVFSDPWNESERQMIYAAREGTELLIDAHERLWSELWRADIVIEGDAQRQRDVRFALFNLYSSIREGSRRSIAPMGLSSKGYNGHIFWDAEIWMFPPLLLLHPELARQMLDYRIDRLDAARQRAYTYGYSGAMYPWESDDSGEESTPTFALTGPLEHHITADIAIACWSYYCVTKDAAWLREKAFPLMRETALFWCDRVVENDDRSYSIRNVVGADEYAIGITDNTFTNGAVRRALEYTTLAAQICHATPDPQWARIAANLRIPAFPDGTLREHATYVDEQIKQADANLLGYPLKIVTEKDALLRDLVFYENKIDPRNGPAMSYSIFSILYSRIGMRDKACEMFRRCYEPNLRPPFRVFAETPTSNNPYFMTGAAGMLQTVLFGFGGLDITSKGIVRTFPVMLPPNWRKLTITSADGKVF